MLLVLFTLFSLQRQICCSSVSDTNDNDTFINSLRRDLQANNYDYLDKTSFAGDVKSNDNDLEPIENLTNTADVFRRKNLNKDDLDRTAHKAKKLRKAQTSRRTTRKHRHKQSVATPFDSKTTKQGSPRAPRGSYRDDTIPWHSKEDQETEFKKTSVLRSVNHERAQQVAINQFQSWLAKNPMEARKESTSRTLEWTIPTKPARAAPGPPAPHQLDMAQARGSKIEQMRNNNRLCSRNVLVPEGPKYDSAGDMYRAAGLRPGRGHGGAFATRAPPFLLPRCCNCCQKSVLGCE